MSAYGKAKTIDGETLKTIIDQVSCEPELGERNRVMVMLSFYAGLRAAEISGLTWNDMTDAAGKLRTQSFWIPAHIAKKGSAREVPLHPHLVEALASAFKTRKGDAIVFMQTDHTRAMSPNYVAQWFRQTYAKMGLNGCSSHSGRRTVLTNMARDCNQQGCSLRDVQLLAGHSYINTTEQYIEPSKNVGKLVSALYKNEVAA